MNKINFIFGNRIFCEMPKKYENELFTLKVKGVLLIVTFKNARENLFIDLSKLVKIEPSGYDPNWICVYVIGKKDGKVKELQFDCGGKTIETKQQIIKFHKESTKCQGIETSLDGKWNSYGWGLTSFTTFGGNLRVWKHSCYLCAREAEKANLIILTHPKINCDIENQIKEFRHPTYHSIPNKKRNFFEFLK
jgi:hypothetical protein